MRNFRLALFNAGSQKQPTSDSLCEVGFHRHQEGLTAGALDLAMAKSFDRPNAPRRELVIGQRCARAHRTRSHTLLVISELKCSFRRDPERCWFSSRMDSILPQELLKHATPHVPDPSQDDRQYFLLGVGTQPNDMSASCALDSALEMVVRIFE